VDDVRVRRALSMAVDRKSIVENVTKGGQEPAQWFARPGLTAAPTMRTHPNRGIKYDPE
jgi:oligopeptide transport system substrate-binding protein